MKIVVVGGTGFLGKQICLAGLNAGYKVTSISRAGIPQLNDGTFPLSALSQIQWKKGDIFKPETYSEELNDTGAVIHTMGTLLDDPRYKSLLRSSTGNAINSALNLPGLLWSLAQGSNPLKESSYNKLNRDSAIILAQEFEKAISSVNANASPEQALSSVPVTPKPFIYISAENWNPLIDGRYVESKREAETALDLIPSLRGVYLRPGLMYDEKAGFGDARHMLATSLNIAGRACSKLAAAISAQIVARAAIEAVGDETIYGSVSLDALQKYASYIPV